MRRYETIYILRPTLGEEEITTIVENTSKIITDDGGVIIETDKWGMRKLAYPIDKETQGFYVFCDYAGTPAAVAEVERKFKIDDSILRYMTLKTSSAMTAEQIETATGEVDARIAAVQEAAEADTVEASDTTTDKGATTAKVAGSKETPTEKKSVEAPEASE